LLGYNFPRRWINWIRSKHFQTFVGQTDATSHGQRFQIDATRDNGCKTVISDAIAIGKIESGHGFQHVGIDDRTTVSVPVKVQRVISDLVPVVKFRNLEKK
jgi:hypothetical protein